MFQSPLPIHEGSDTQVRKENAKHMVVSIPAPIHEGSDHPNLTDAALQSLFQSAVPATSSRRSSFNPA